MAVPTMAVPTMAVPTMATMALPAFGFGFQAASAGTLTGCGRRFCVALSEALAAFSDSAFGSAGFAASRACACCARRDFGLSGCSATCCALGALPVRLLSSHTLRSLNGSTLPPPSVRPARIFCTSPRRSSIGDGDDRDGRVRV
eukprot:scaffold55049_cov28-Phaeocystis_antarctica.AAC.1